jgi:hypothetical protein
MRTAVFVVALALLGCGEEDSAPNPFDAARRPLPIDRFVGTWVRLPADTLTIDRGSPLLNVAPYAVIAYRSDTPHLSLLFQFASARGDTVTLSDNLGGFSVPRRYVLLDGGPVLMPWPPTTSAQFGLRRVDP